MTSGNIASKARLILRYLGVDRTVTKHFLPRFLKDHPDFLIRKQKPLVVDRQNAHDIEAITKIFRLYKDARVEYNILNENVFNINETGFRIGVEEDQYIVTREPHRKLTIRDPNNRESLTSIETIRGDGTAIPPYVILSGKQFLKKWFEATNLSEDASFDTSDTGYSNDEISMNYLEHFNRNTPPKGVWRMLILDGHESHNHADFVTRCKKLKILPFQLYPLSGT